MGETVSTELNPVCWGSLPPEIRQQCCTVNLCWNLPPMAIPNNHKQQLRHPDPLAPMAACTRRATAWSTEKTGRLLFPLLEIFGQHRSLVEQPWSRRVKIVQWNPICLAIHKCWIISIAEIGLLGNWGASRCSSPELLGPDVVRGLRTGVGEGTNSLNLGKDRIRILIPSCPIRRRRGYRSKPARYKIVQSASCDKAGNWWLRIVSEQAA
mmetsp:Transcript_6283/g.13584  ORF Transcript_6283/g.13584 Transcript_6283/m.13584 type:complete len:210 (-) Transcript_6283:745-1374(-)